MSKAVWQDSKVKFFSRLVKAHDYALYAERNHLGIICIYRRSKRLEFVFADESTSYYMTKDSPQFVCAITDNWKTNGKPREWGSDVVLNYIRKHDGWTNESWLEDMEAHNDKIKKSEQRSFRNETEAFFSDTRSRFKRDFNDVRTCNLDKSEKRRRLIDKGLEAKVKKIKEI